MEQAQANGINAQYGEVAADEWDSPVFDRDGNAYAI